MRKDSKVLVLAALFVIIAAVSMLVTAACDKEPENTLPPVASGTVVITPDSIIPTNVEPNIRGYITRITNSAEYTEILVEYFPKNEEAPEYSYSKVLVKLDDKSAVAYGSNTEIFARTALAVGSVVDVWFSDPTAESYPVLAYGQAVRVVNDPNSMTDIIALPYLTISGSSTCATVVSEAAWNDKTIDNPNVKQLLEKVSGARISASQGDAISLKFSSEPDEASAYWSSSPYVNGHQLELAEGKITIPETSGDQIYIRINASWGENSVQYVFSVTLPDTQDAN